MPLSMPDDEIRRRHKWGCPVGILAELNNCDQQSIREVLKEENDMSKFDWEEARKLYDAGASDQKIGQQLGCSAVTVFQWRRKNDLPTKHQGWGGKVKAKKPALIPSEATMAGELIQSVAESTSTPGGSRPARPTTCTIPVIAEPAAEDLQQEIDDLKDDVDDLLHEWYLEVKKAIKAARQPAVRPITFSDMVYYPGVYEQDDIDDLLAEMYSYEQCMRQQSEMFDARRIEYREKIDRLTLENQLLIAMLMGAGVRDVREKLGEVMAG